MQDEDEGVKKPFYESAEIFCLGGVLNWKQRIALPFALASSAILVNKACHSDQGAAAELIQGESGGDSLELNDLSDDSEVIYGMPMPGAGTGGS